MKVEMEKRLKTGGRKAGIPNRVTSEMKDIISDLLSNQYDDFIKKMNEIDNPVDYCNVYLKAMSFVVPKPSANQVGSISQRRLARKSRGSPRVTFCPMCGKVNTSCDCGYKQ